VRKAASVPRLGRRPTAAAPPGLRSVLESVENARDGFEEASDHLGRTPRYSGLVLGPVREVAAVRLSPGQLAWERAVSSKGRGAPRSPEPLSGTLELRVGGRLTRSASAARDGGAGTLLERLPGEPAVELRASFEPPSHRLRWKSLLRALRAEIESDEST
jgi:hypothetical protein